MQPILMFKKHRSAAPQEISDFRWGLIGLALVVAGGLVVIFASFAGTGTATYTATAYDAGAISAGDDVRVAGIPVGKVSGVELADDHVLIRFDISTDVFVGSESTVSVRMLTVVGGNYLALTPAGTSPLESRAIRHPIQTPYNLPELFQDAVTPIDEIDGATFRETFAGLGTSLGNAPDALRELITATDSVVEVLNKQSADVSRTLAMADEYLTALNENRASVRQIIDSWILMEDMAEQSLASVGSALGTVARMLERLAPLGTHWDSELRPRIVELAETIPPLEDLQSRLTEFLDSAQTLGSRLEPLSGHAREVTICVPLPERPC